MGMSWLSVVAVWALAQGYDYDAPDLVERVKAELGIEYEAYYERDQCIRAFERDHCFPTAYIDAIEKGEPYISLWKAESLMNVDQDREAEALLLKLEKEHPSISRTKWLLAKNLFFRSDRLPEDAIDEKDKHLTRGVQYARECVDMDPDDINCQLNLATLLGRWSTNQGMIKGARNASDVLEAMRKASRSPQHYRYPSGNTALGASFYALGIFYRLAPDSFWVQLFFGVRGDIDKSIANHQRALATKTDQIELYTEMAASSFCKAERDDSRAALERGRKHVATCQSFTAKSKIDAISQADCGKLKANPDLGCGYSRDRQQETDVEKLKAAN